MPKFPWNLWIYQIFWSKTRKNVLLIRIGYRLMCIVICIVLLKINDTELYVMYITFGIHLSNFTNSCRLVYVWSVYNPHHWMCSELSAQGQPRVLTLVDGRRPYFSVYGITYGNATAEVDSTNLKVVVHKFQANKINKVILTKKLSFFFS